MHTTNNVPQSRCRVFLIYGELSEMGRWSKRRWRHAEGLHFSLFSPHKQEKPVSVCHNTQTHSHTPLKDTSTCTHADMYHPHYLHADFATTTITSTQTHTHLSPAFSTQISSPLQPTTKHTWRHPPPTHTQPKIIYWLLTDTHTHKQILRVRLDPIENSQ